MNIKIHNPNNLPTIDYREVEEFQGNLKDLTKDNYARLKKSIEENGFFIPMFLWKHKGKFKVLDAHQRLRVLKKEEATPYEIPYIEIEAKDEQDAKKKLLLISSQYGTITREGLDEFAFDLEDDWMADTLNFDNIFDFDKVIDIEEDEYEVPDKIKTDIKLGDLFQLGDHKLLCGDATNADDVERLMDDWNPDMVFTDPPYGINVEKMTLGTGKKKFYRGNWDKRIDISFLLDYAEKICIWGGNYFADLLPVTNDWLCWHKKNDGLSFSEFELAWTNFGINCRHITHHWSGEEKVHPTQKPLAVMVWGLRLTDANIVLDLFGGSGSTLIACEQLNRRCLMSEISPEYCQIIIDRWEKFSGRKAEKRINTIK